MHEQINTNGPPNAPSALASLFALQDGAWPEPTFGDAGGSAPLHVGFDASAGVTLGSTASPRPAVRETRDLKTLLDRIRRRDESALNELHTACADRLLAAALRILHRPEMACEAVSSAFLQIWNHAGDFDDRRANVVSWLSMIVRSRALDMLRQNRVRAQYECALGETELESIAGACPQPCSGVEQSQRRVGLRRAMATLTPTQRQVLSLIFLEGRSHEEAAAHIGLPLGTLKSHSRRALAALRSHAGLRAARA